MPPPCVFKAGGPCSHSPHSLTGPHTHKSLSINKQDVMESQLPTKCQLQNECVAPCSTQRELLQHNTELLPQPQGYPYS